MDLMGGLLALGADALRGIIGAVVQARPELCRDLLPIVTDAMDRERAAALKRVRDDARIAEDAAAERAREEAGQ